MIFVLICALCVQITYQLTWDPACVKYVLQIEMMKSRLSHLPAIIFDEIVSAMYLESFMFFILLQQMKALLESVGTSFCPKYLDWFGFDSSDSQSRNADRSVLSKFLQARPADFSTTKLQVCPVTSQLILEYEKWWKLEVGKAVHCIFLAVL